MVVKSSAFVWATTGVAYLGATVLYVVLRSVAATGAGAGLPVLSWGRSIWDLAAATAYYLVKVLVPWPQSNMVTWDMLPGQTGAIAILLLAAILVVLAIRRLTRGRDGVPFLALLSQSGSRSRSCHLCLLLWRM